MDKVDAVQQMQDYLDTHYQEEVSLAELAQVSLFSPWYAWRLFKELTGISPGEYQRRLRLSRSALRLREPGCRVIDVAFEMGFGSVDGYQRAFLREFGCNPREYARRPVPLPLFIPYGVKYQRIMEEHQKMTDMQTVFVQLVTKPQRRVLIKRGVKADDYMTYCAEVGCDVWGLLTSIPDTLGEPVCLWLPDHFIRPGTSCYVQGVEVALDYAGTIPEGFDSIILPEADYLLFRGEPFVEEDYCAAIEGVQQAIEKYDPTWLGYAWDEENPRIQLEPRGERGYEELLPIKEVIR